MPPGDPARANVVSGLDGFHETTAALPAAALSDRVAVAERAQVVGVPQELREAGHLKADLAEMRTEERDPNRLYGQDDGTSGAFRIITMASALARDMPRMIT